MGNFNHKIFNSDVYSGISNLDDESIDCSITSPPYWGQRDYEFEGQIGTEDTYEEYLLKMLSIFDLLRTKMKNDGVFFLNIGDKYLSRYGKTPLAMIPYKLAYLMKQEGWIIADIIIWYKPNHMPSSVKNRFVNSYEPVFAFSKSQNNILSRYRNSIKNYTNILKINLQPSSLKHIAVYPENLVSSLMNMVDLPKEACILDPFGGSGTTLKVVLDLNMSIHNFSLSSVMIENNNEYVKIMKDRFRIPEENITRFDFINYTYEKSIPDNFIIEKVSNVHNGFRKEGQLIIFDEMYKYDLYLSGFYNNKYKKLISNSSSFLVGCKEFNIDLIYKTSLLNKYGWIIRNMVVVENNNVWFPMFFIVDDNKKVNYNFNFKKLQIKSKSSSNLDLTKLSYLGMKVVNKILKNKKSGYIVEIVEKYDNGFPKYVIIKWDDNTYSKEFVILNQDEINQNLIYRFNNSKIPNIYEKHFLTGINNLVNFENNNIKQKEFKKNEYYKGKYKDISRKNWGASPGARASINEIYFSTKRLYDVDQKIVADYLNKKRIQKKFSKKNLTNLFHKEYKHTVGHWLRKDFGGSLPTPEDWFLLSRLLYIDDYYTYYVCKTGLKLQIVNSNGLKNPEDYQNISQIKHIGKIISSSEVTHISPSMVRSSGIPKNTTQVIPTD